MTFIVCEKCGNIYQSSAISVFDVKARKLYSRRVITGKCENCKLLEKRKEKQQNENTFFIIDKNKMYL